MNRSRTIFMVATLCALGIFLGTSSTYAQTQGTLPPCCGGASSNFWDGLTPEQQKQVTSLRLDFLKKAAGLRAQIAQKRIELLELSTKDSPDEQAINNKQKEIWALQDSAVQDRRTMMTKMRELLTPEQKQKFGSFDTGMRGMGAGGCCGMRAGRGCGMGMGGGRGCGMGMGQGPGYGMGMRSGPGFGMGATPPCCPVNPGNTTGSLPTEQPNL
jgi:Spy/CpxP family protein refolding chaperone